MRNIVNRLKRWAAIDAFAAIQEPTMRDEHNARAAATALLAEVMEMSPGRSPHEALQILEAAIREPRPPVSDYQEIKSPLIESTLFPRVSMNPPPPLPIPEPPQGSVRPTVPAAPFGKTRNRKQTLYGLPTAPPPPDYNADFTDQAKEEPDDEPA